MHYLTLCAAPTPGKKQRAIRLHIFIFSSFFFSHEKEGSLAHKFAGGKGEDNGVDQASFEEVSPYREANDRKAKLLKFEQSIFFKKFLSYFP